MPRPYPAREPFRDPHGPEFFAPAPTPAELRAAKEAFDRQWRRAFHDWADEWALSKYAEPTERGFRAGFSAGLAAAAQAAIEADVPQPRDPRDPDHSKTGIFVNNRCWKCNDGEKPCARGGAHRCDYPRARND